MQIKNAIIHRIEKAKNTSGPGSVEIRPREDELPIDNLLIKLVTDILGLYRRLSNSYGSLSGENGVARFPSFLADYHADESSLVDFTRKVTSVIAETMSQEQFTTTSYPIFFRYETQGRDWLLVALLKLKERTGIDEETLDLNASLAFDISHLREAARIDLAKWGANIQPYLSFIKKGSGTDAESSRFFRNALSCQDYIDAKFHTDAAISAVTQFCASQEWSAEKRQEVRNIVYEYMKEKKESGEPVNIVALSSRIDDQNPEAFIDFVREKEIELNETFSPHPASYRGLQRLTKKFGTISLGFDVDDVVSERVSYNDDDNVIVVRNPPPDLVKAIRSAKGEDLEDE